MAVTRVSQSSLKEGLEKSNNFMAGFAPLGMDYHSIATVTVGSGGASQFEFTGIPSGYQHLQLRVALIANTNVQYAYLRFNGDTANNYAWHNLYGQGSSVLAEASASVSGISTVYVDGTTYASVGVVDILDYASTTNNKTVRRFTGREFNGSGTVDVGSGLWMSTSAITAVRLIATTNTFKQHSTAALYGIKA